MKRLRGLFGVAFVVAPLSISSCGDDETTAAPVDCDLDCTDQNPCTLDFCSDGACIYEPAASGTSCDDLDLCDGESLCDGAGQCAPGIPVDIDDADPCTVDACEPTTGEVTHVQAQGCLSWIPLTASGAPTPRTRHSAVWTGTEMIVWGGEDERGVTDSGARYDPARATWTPMSSAGAPAARHNHAAVWTGSRMIVWGGFGEREYEIGGGVYDPRTDTWTAMTTDNAPSGRSDHGAVWSGTELVVWGGAGPAALGDGASYEPESDTWTTLPTVGAPSPRYAHSAIWATDRMIVWGGQNLSDWLGDGGVLVGGQWSDPTPSAGAPTARQDHSAIWTGDEMVVWGGFTGGPYEDTGAMFDPFAGSSGEWEALSTAGPPQARTQHTAVWTGSRMFVFGGCGTDSCSVLFGDGGLWTPSSSGGQWAAVNETAALPPRKDATAVWTGNTVIVWGGGGQGAPLGSGALAVIPD